jgi:hypothetical protein
MKVLADYLADAASSCPVRNSIAIQRRAWGDPRNGLKLIVSAD